MTYQKSNLKYIDLSDYSSKEIDEIIGNNYLLAWNIEEPDYYFVVEHTAQRFGLDPEQFEEESGLLDIDTLEELILERAESGLYGEYVLVEYGNDRYTENCVYLVEKKVAEDLLAEYERKR